MSIYLNGWLLGVGFIALIFFGFFSGFVRAVQSKSWPRTRGRVTKSRIEERSSTDPDSSSHRQTTTYEPKVTYSYTVDGKAQESRQIGIGVMLGSKADAAKAIARYPVGAEVTVYHHAKRHYLAVLEPGGWLVPLVVTILTGIVLGFVSVIWINKSLRPDADPFGRPIVQPSNR